MPTNIRLMCGREWDRDGLVIVGSANGDPEKRTTNRLYFTWKEEECGKTRGDNGALHLDLMAAQKLSDMLYDCGIRPSQSHGSPGQVGAMTEHIADMRNVVNALLGTVKR